MNKHKHLLSLTSRASLTAPLQCRNLFLSSKLLKQIDEESSSGQFSCHSNKKTEKPWHSSTTPNLLQDFAMVMSNLSTLYTVLADNYSLHPQHVITCSASQSVPNLHSPPPCPQPCVWDWWGAGWRRKDCRAPGARQDGQRLGSIAAVLCIKGTNSGKTKNHPAVMRTNVAEGIHPQHPPRAGADRAFAHARVPVCRAWVEMPLWEHGSGSATCENSDTLTCVSQHGCACHPLQQHRLAAVLTAVCCSRLSPELPPSPMSCDIWSGQCIKSCPPSSLCSTCLNIAETDNAWGHVWDWSTAGLQALTLVLRHMLLDMLISELLSSGQWLRDFLKAQLCARVRVGFERKRKCRFCSWEGLEGGCQSKRQLAKSTWGLQKALCCENCFV